MNPLDVAGVIVLGAAMVRGMVRGFAREMRGLGGILLAVLLALRLRIPVGAWVAGLAGGHGYPWVWEAAAFLVLVLGFAGLAAAAASRLWVQPHHQGAVFVDVAGGGVVGLLEGWLLFTAGVALLLRWPAPEVTALLGGSELAGMAFRFLPVLHRFVSGSQIL